MTYLYALSQRQPALRSLAAADAAACHPLAGEIQVLPAGPFFALTSPVAESDFVGEAAEEQLRDLEWLAPRALRHEAIVRAAHEETDVIPARFATVFSSPEALTAWVAAQEQALAQAFARLHGAEEWGVRLVGAPEGETESLSAPAEPPAAATGRSYLAAVRQRREHAAQRAACARQLVGSFAQRVQPLIREWAFRRPFVFACLLARENRQIFAMAAEEFSRPEMGLRFELSGPWPPYSFVRDLPKGHRAASFEARATPREAGPGG